MSDVLNRPVSNPERADNAALSVKCPVCGDVIEIGLRSEQESITCPICQEQFYLHEAQKLNSSNEGY